ncbi:MAG: T9SS type A sorting domain-containing protein [Cytophagales bacterium]
MKKSLLLTIAICLTSIYSINAQCTFGIVSDTSQKNNEDPIITKIIRNDDGKIIYKEIFNKDGILFAVDSFYYSGNYQLDSIIQFDTQGQRTPFYVINQWSNGKIIKQFRSIDDGQIKRDTSVLTYNSQGVLTSFKSSVLTLEQISYNSQGNIGSAKIRIIFMQNSILVDAVINFDDKPGSFKELGLTDDLFSHYNNNNFVSIAPVTSPSNLVVSITYTYNSFGKVTSAVRNELLENTVITAKYGTDCKETTSLNNSSTSIQSKIYPNPSNTGFVNVPSLNNSTVQVFSISGMKVLETNDNVLNVNSLNKGIYAVKYRDINNNQKIERLIID